MEDVDAGDCRYDLNMWHGHYCHSLSLIVDVSFVQLDNCNGIEIKWQQNYVVVGGPLELKKLLSAIAGMI